MKLTEALTKGYRFKRAGWNDFSTIAEIGTEDVLWDVDDWEVETVEVIKDEDFYKATQEVMEDHKDLFSKLADQEKAEKNATGLKYSTGKPKMSLVSYESIAGEARALEDGLTKYSKNNYKLGLLWSEMLDAASRHLYKFSHGEDCAPDSKLNHLYHAKACLGILIYYYENKIGKDDR